MRFPNIARPLPGPVIATQHWDDATFLHWRTDPAQVARILPDGVRPDLWEGDAYVGVVAFRLRDAALGPLPPFRRWGTFAEINVRVYGIDAAGRRGVVFASLDAPNLPAVLTARHGFGLPYRLARTSLQVSAGTIRYDSARRGAAFTATVEPDRSASIDDDQDRFLTARYGVFRRRWHHTRLLPNHHEPWTLHPAHARQVEGSLLAAVGFDDVDPARPDSVLFSPGVLSRFSRAR